MFLIAVGSVEIVLILLLLSILWALGRYARDTRIGFGGGVLLGILFTPIIAFLILSILKSPRSARFQ